MYQQRQKKCVCNDISHVSMRTGDKNSPRTSTCEDFLASIIAISGVRCYTILDLVFIAKNSFKGYTTVGQYSYTGQ